MGMEILIPSGILCMAMAKVKLRPRVVLVELAKKVAIPSDWSYQASWVS